MLDAVEVDPDSEVGGLVTDLVAVADLGSGDDLVEVGGWSGEENAFAE